MNIQKPHFWYNKSQRNGVFLLLSSILVLQVVYHSVDTSFSDVEVLSENEVDFLERQIDSLKQIELTKRNSKIYSFNPNYLSDYKAARFGMSITEIDRLFLYRKKGKFINSVGQFKEVTRISDSLLSTISPHFKFPAWVQNRTHKFAKNGDVKKEVKDSVYTAFVVVKDVNKAAAIDLEIAEGIHPFLAKRIIAYRNKLQGFTYQKQLLEVWGLDKGVATNFWNVFEIYEKPSIQKINFNVASFKEVLTNPYIDFKLCKKMFDYRDEVAELQSIQELKNIKGFPLDKYDRIVLYLEAK